MPRQPNKIIIDDLDFEADSFSLRQAFKAGLFIGDEIIALEKGITGPILKEDADLHLAEQESICADTRKAMADSISRQRALNEKRRKWFDTKL